MKKILVISLFIFIFYGCKSASTDSDTSFYWGNNESSKAKQNILDDARSELVYKIKENICYNNIFTLTFNKTTYKTISLKYHESLLLTDQNNKTYSTTQTTEEAEETSDGNIKIVITKNDVTNHVNFNMKERLYWDNNTNAVSFQSMCNSFAKKYVNYENTYSITNNTPCPSLEDEEIQVGAAACSTLKQKKKNTKIPSTIVLRQATSGDLTGFALKSLRTYDQLDLLYKYYIISANFVKNTKPSKKFL